MRGRSRDVEARYIIPPTPEQLDLYKSAYTKIDIQPNVDLDYIRKRQETSEKIMSKIMSGESLTDEDRADIKRFNIDRSGITDFYLVNVEGELGLAWVSSTMDSVTLVRDAITPWSFVRVQIWKKDNAAPSFFF